MRNKNIVITIIVAFVVGAASFFGGMQYQKVQEPKFFTAGGNMMGGRAASGNTQFGERAMGERGFTPVAGEIIEADDKSITVKMQDGSSKIVVFSDKTAINKSSEGTKSDLKAGEKVAVFGSQNADGSVTAENIQLNPQMRVMQIRPSGASTQ